MMRASIFRISPLLLLAAALIAMAVFFAPGPKPVYAQDTCVLPGTPQNVQVTAGNNKLTLTWEEPASWGGWDGEGQRFYVVHWRQSGADPEREWNLTDTGRSRNPPASSYVFTGTYEEELSNPRRFVNHTVTNGTGYDLSVTATYTTHDCATIRGYAAEASGTPTATQGTPSADATLSGLEISNATTGSDARVGFPPDAPFSSAHSPDFWFVPVLKEVTHVTIKPTATAGDLATITVQLETGGTPQTVASGKVSNTIWMAPRTDLTVPHDIYVKVTAEDGVTTRTYKLRVYKFEPISFGDDVIPAEQFTVGAEVPNFSSGKYRGREILTLALPTVTTHDQLNVSYTATGLPAGLSMDKSRIIRGVPEAVTTSPATVTYTATSDELGSSASLTFDVTVNPPVAFAEEDLETFFGRVITFTAGQAQPLTITLPEATGGSGTLAYELLFNSNPDTVTSDVPGAGVNLDTSTRVLTIDGNSNVNRVALKNTGYAVTYRAKDENGSKASAVSSISVVGPPTLPEITDKTFTAGAAVSVTLPAATGTWWNMVPSLSYRLEPVVKVDVTDDGEVSRTIEILDMEGMSFNTVSRILSGTPEFAGSTEMTYTATDGNGVSATKTFTINVVNGPDVPTSEPASVQADQASSGGAAVAVWGALAGATEYVVQVIADGGSYPDKPVNSAPDGVSLDFRSTQVVIVGLSDGDYKVRVAARNNDGVGPWSDEVSFTVRIGGV